MPKTALMTIEASAPELAAAAAEAEAFLAVPARLGYLAGGTGVAILGALAMAVGMHLAADGFPALGVRVLVAAALLVGLGSWTALAGGRGVRSSGYLSAVLLLGLAALVTVPALQGALLAAAGLAAYRARRIQRLRRVLLPQQSWTLE
jgi:hypothetical protein